MAGVWAGKWAPERVPPSLAAAVAYQIDRCLQTAPQRAPREPVLLASSVPSAQMWGLSTLLMRVELLRPCPSGAALDQGLAKLPAPWFAKQTSALYYLPRQVQDQIDDL